MIKAINPNILICAVAIVIAAYFLRQHSEPTNQPLTAITTPAALNAANPVNTQEYWNQVVQLRERGKVEGQREPSETVWNQKQFQEYANATTEQSKAFGDIISAIEALSPSNVDPEAVEFALLLAETYRQRLPIYEHALQINQSLYTYDQRYNSTGAFWEAVIRGALGDPTGLANEQRTDLHGIQVEIKALQTAWNENTVRIRNVESRQAALKIHLIQKYPKQFQ